MEKGEWGLWEEGGGGTKGWEVTRGVGGGGGAIDWRAHAADSPSVTPTFQRAVSDGRTTGGRLGTSLWLAAMAHREYRMNLLVALRRTAMMMVDTNSSSPWLHQLQH